MVSASKEAVDLRPAAASHGAPSEPVASLNARLSAYLVDSVVLAAFILVFFVLAGLQLLATSDWGGSDPPDEAIVAFIAVLSGGTLLTWSAFNIALLRWRGQTTGMYVLGIKAVGDDGSPLSPGQALLRWFALHPLLLHPFALPLWAVLTLLSVDFALSRGGVVMVIAIALLAVASLFINLGLVLFGEGRSALHDRIARTHVVHIEQP